MQKCSLQMTLKQEYKFFNILYIYYIIKKNDL